MKPQNAVETKSILRHPLTRTDAPIALWIEHLTSFPIHWRVSPALPQGRCSRRDLLIQKRAAILLARISDASLWYIVGLLTKSVLCNDKKQLNYTAKGSIQRNPTRFKKSGEYNPHTTVDQLQMDLKSMIETTRSTTRARRNGTSPKCNVQYKMHWSKSNSPVR